MSHPVYTWSLLPDVEVPGSVVDRSKTTGLTGTDWELDADGDLIFPLRYTEGPQAVAQGIRIAILTFKGEIFSDTDRGVDYQGLILGQKYNELVIRAEFRRVIKQVTGVDEILTLEGSFDRPSRTLTVHFRVRTSFGVIAGQLQGV